VQSRPQEFFMPGALSMLRTFCEVSVALEELGARLVADPADGEAVERFRKLAPVQASLAQKLRITVLSAMRTDKAAVTSGVGATRSSSNGAAVGTTAAADR
jgi:hypothetical protein